MGSLITIVTLPTSTFGVAQPTRNKARIINLDKEEQEKLKPLQFLKK